jgi:hypothetical protein
MKKSQIKYDKIETKDGASYLPEPLDKIEKD